MDFNELLHDHQIALMKAGKPASVEEGGHPNSTVNRCWEYIQSARTALGVEPYPPSHNTITK